MHKRECVNALRMFDIDKNGGVKERPLAAGQTIWLDNTVVGRLYPGIQMALGSMPLTTLEPHEEAAVFGRLAKPIRLDGEDVEYVLVGAGGSAKNGKFLLVAKEYERELSERFDRWPEAAAVYFGILTGECQSMIEVPSARVMFVRDGEWGTNDCGAWGRASLMKRLQLRQFFSKNEDGTKTEINALVQFRMGAGRNGDSLKVQLKGSMKVLADDICDAMGVDFIIPESCAKPAIDFIVGTTQVLDVVVGIREVSRGWTFDSSYTVTQFAPPDSMRQEIIPAAIARVRELKAAWRAANHLKVVELVGKAVHPDDLASQADAEGTKAEDAEYQRTLDALLLADGDGSLTRHPWVHRTLNRLIARWAYKGLTGGWLHLPAFALSHDGYIAVAKDGTLISGSDWMPLDGAIVTAPLESKRGLCVRYPVRMKEDLLPMRHLHEADVVALLVARGLDLETATRVAREQLLLHGTYTLNSETAKKNGGDFDFDMVCVIDEALYPRFVEWRFTCAVQPEVKKTKASRSHSPWFNLPAVVYKAKRNEIGRITNMSSTALAYGRLDIHYALVPELQKEVDGLKHNTHADLSLLTQWKDELGEPPVWLSLKEVQTVSELPMFLEGTRDTDVIGFLYNQLRPEIEDMLGKPMRVSDFRGLIVGYNPTAEMFWHVDCARKVWNFYHTYYREKLAKARTILEAADKAVEAARQNNAGAEELAELKRARRKASEALREANNDMKDRTANLRSILTMWGATVKGNRMAWAEALHSRLAASNHAESTEALLFTAFPQEVVALVAERTGGIRTTVAPSRVLGTAYFEKREHGADLYIQHFGMKPKYMLSLDMKKHKCFVRKAAA